MSSSRKDSFREKWLRGSGYNEEKKDKKLDEYMGVEYD